MSEKLVIRNIPIDSHNGTDSSAFFNDEKLCI